MPYDVLMLILTAVPVGFLHTLMGPDHYIPFVAMARARNWSITKTLWITAGCGVGHVLSAVAIGMVGIMVGFSFMKFKFIDSWRGEIAAWLLISFGLVYFIWGLRNALHNKRHSHSHFFHRHFNHDHEVECSNTSGANNTAEDDTSDSAEGSKSHHHHHQHTHNHTQTCAHTHAHTHTHTPAPRRELTPWVLFIIFILGPCEALLPLMMYPAINSSKLNVFLVCLIFSVTTIITMLLAVSASLYGMRFIKINFWGKYGSATAGAIICGLGLGIKFLGL
jgi:nickel/cobalt transporter (NicO) family protein